jgi:hypothetical protein
MSWFKRSHDYLPTKGFRDEDAESLFSTEQAPTSAEVKSRSQWTWISFLIISNFITAVLVAYATWKQQPDLDNICAAYTSTYSPILKDIDFKYTTETYNGSFFHETIYRQDPSPEVDGAWKDLGVDCK